MRWGRLEATIAATPCGLVLCATPIDLTRVLKVTRPLVRAAYDLAEREPGALAKLVAAVLKD